MVQIIAGEKGKGKTRHLLEKANSYIKEAQGSVVYLDKNSKKMYELSNKIRLINVGVFPVRGADGFVGFVSGIIAQDRDLEMMFLDGFLQVAELEGKDPTDTILELEKLSNDYNVSMIISISLDGAAIPEALKDKVILSL